MDSKKDKIYAQIFYWLIVFPLGIFTLSITVAFLIVVSAFLFVFWLPFRAYAILRLTLKDKQ